MLKRIFLLLAVFILACSFSWAMPPFDPATVPAAPDYSTPGAWLARPDAPTAPVDVFFVYPTVLSNDTDWLMDTADPAMRAASNLPILAQASVFGGQANVYAPMYRQMNLAALKLKDEQAAPIKKIGREDVWRAFIYYLEHENNGRPFFLAGHSQGSMVLADLMREHWGSVGVEDRMVAALLIGWSLTPQDLAANPSLAMCDSADQTGCVISYNTMAAGKQAQAPTLLPGALATNPLSWTTDGTFAPKEQNLGAVFFGPDGSVSATRPHFTSAQIVDGGLIVQPEDQALVTMPNPHFPAGVYHPFDYSLFYENLKANIAERIRAFQKD